MAERSTFVKIDRNIMRWRWYRNANTFRVFIHLLLNANVTDRDFEGITIRRGQLATSQASLASALGLTVKQIRTAIEHLKETGEVAVTQYPKFSVITVISYSMYQDRAGKSAEKSAEQRAVEGQAKGSQRAGEGQQYKNVRKYPTDTKKEKKGGAASDWPPAPGTPEYERLINQ